MSVEQVKCMFGDTEMIIETGKMARQAGGSVTVQCGDTIVLCAATSSSKAKSDCDFLPLTVDYTEKTYAAGRIPGGFFKREGRPSENAILTSRCIDRPIRPLFPDNYYYDTQVITTVLSACKEHPPEMLAIVASSAAIAVSDIPLKKYIAGCRVSRIDGEFKLNVSLSDMERSDLNLVVAATEDAVVMVEGESKVVSENDLVDAIEFAHKSMLPVIQMQKDLAAKCGKEKRDVPQPEVNEEITKAVNEMRDQIQVASNLKIKQERYGKFDEIKTAVAENRG